LIRNKLHFNPKTVFWTNVGKIVLIYFLKNTSLIYSCLTGIYDCLVYREDAGAGLYPGDDQNNNK